MSAKQVIHGGLVHVSPFCSPATVSQGSTTQVLALRHYSPQGYLFLYFLYPHLFPVQDAG